MKSDGNLRQLFRKNLKSVFFTSIESRFTQFGIPDLHGIVDGDAFWIENKKTTGWAVTLRPGQVAWLRRYAAQGGLAYVAVRRAGDELWLVHGAYAGPLQASGLAKLPRRAVAGQWGGGPSGWQWGAVLAALRAG
jgi:hypothetical protein